MGEIEKYYCPDGKIRLCCDDKKEPKPWKVISHNDYGPTSKSFDNEEDARRYFKKECRKCDPNKKLVEDILGIFKKN